MAYDPDWTDGDHVAVGDPQRLTYLRELTEAVNRRFNVIYSPAVDYSAHLLGGYTSGRRSTPGRPFPCRTCVWR